MPGPKWLLPRPKPIRVRIVADWVPVPQHHRDLVARVLPGRS